jgi:hypothetical protein
MTPHCVMPERVKVGAHHGFDPAVRGFVARVVAALAPQDEVGLVARRVEWLGLGFV